MSAYVLSDDAAPDVDDIIAVAPCPGRDTNRKSGPSIALMRSPTGKWRQASRMDEIAVSSPENGSNTRAVHDVLRAACFAAARHSRQRRKGAAEEPYINHLLEVAGLVSSALSEPDTNLVIAALLHDTIEDVGVTKEELVQAFGADVAELVVELTDDKALPKAERKRLQIVNAPKKSVRAQVIKMADKISNLRALLSSPPADWSVQRRHEYFEWAKQVVDGLTAPNQKLKTEFARLYRKAATLDSPAQRDPSADDS